MLSGVLAPLVLTLAVAAGLVTATVSVSWVHSRQTSFFRWFLANILLFNLLILLGLTFQLARSQLVQETGAHAGVLLLPLIVLMAPLKLGWLYAFVGMNRALLGGELQPGSGRTLGVLGAFVVALYGALLALGATGNRPGILQMAVFLFDTLVLGAAAVSAGWLVSSAAALPVSVRRRALLVFGVLHVLLFVAMGGIFALGQLRGRSHESYTGLLLIVFNLFPLAWIVRFQPAGPGALSEEANPYGLTSREREVVELIGAGRTNQEIADQLFISLATVKDHNHNIFRKTGVRNRTELANVLRDRPFIWSIDRPSRR